MVTTLTQPGDVVVTMGTGDVTHHARSILDHLRQRATLGRVGVPI